MTHFRAIQTYLLLKQREDVDRASELAVLEEYLAGEMGVASVDFGSFKNWVRSDADLTDFERRNVELSLRAVEITLKYRRIP